MSKIEHQEVPQGYIWKDCVGANILVPMPETWFYIPSENTDFLTFDFSSKQNSVQSIFEPNFNIQVYPRTARQNNLSPEETLQVAIIKSPVMSPITAEEIINDGTFISRRAHYRSEPQEIEGIMSPEQWFYIDHTINTQTGTLYTSAFHAPIKYQKQYEPTAKVMVEQRILNPNF